METMKPIQRLTLVTALAFQHVSAADYAAMSNGSGVPQAALSSHCKKIECTYDKIKDTVQATASDRQGWLPENAGVVRLKFTWISDSTEVLATAYNWIDLYQTDWDFIENAEIYIGKETITKLSNVDRQIGNYNSYAKRTMKLETVSGSITLEQAEKIALAPIKDITIRFHSKNGYKDLEGLRSHKLMNLIELAKAK